MEDPGFTRLKQGIHETLGFNADRYEPKHFRRRIQSRMRATGTQDYNTYLGHLKNNADEREKLKAALTINVTEFFRNPEVYQVFSEKMVPKLLKEQQAGMDVPLRIWSLGCATGEEPYSIAMIFADAIENTLHKGVRIYATDIDADSIDIGNKRRYKDINTIPAGFIKKYLTEEPG